MPALLEPVAIPLLPAPLPDARLPDPPLFPAPARTGIPYHRDAVHAKEEPSLQPWELDARECIRDLVARYNANGDSGRFEEVLALFTSDATIEVSDETFHGPDAIRALFERAASRAKTADRTPPGFLRHFTATHQIDLLDESTATGRSYFVVFTADGPDHWGRYLDEYRRVGATWRFAKRRVLVDARAPTSLFVSDRAIDHHEERS